MNYLNEGWDVDFKKVDKETFKTFLSTEEHTRSHWADASVFKDSTDEVIAIYVVADDSYHIALESDFDIGSILPTATF